MKFQKLVTSALLVAGTASALAVVPVSVNAATSKTAPVVAVQNKANFTKEGYIMRVLNDRDASPIYVGKANYNKLVKNVTRLKVLRLSVLRKYKRLSLELKRFLM